jgi:ABC-type multidrug transport system ATPase subunit
MAVYSSQGSKLKTNLMKFIKAENINFGYKENSLVFRNVSFELKSDGDAAFITAIMGSSGSGKSTLLKLLLNIETINSGTIITSPVNPVISYVPQEPVLFEHLSPMENARYFSRISSYRSKFNEELFAQLIITLELRDVFKYAKSVNEISGGQKQRLSLLRALSIQPDFLLLDEPLTGMDEEVKENFLIKLLEIIQPNNIMVLYVTHHSREVEMVANDILFLLKDKSENAVTEAIKLDVKSFLSSPPTLSALKAFRHNDDNVIKFSLDNEGKLVPINQNSESLAGQNFSLSFNSKNIGFSDHTGFPFRPIAETNVYSCIKLIDHNITISICKDYFDEKNGRERKYLFLNGAALKYNSAGFFETTIIIDKNRIVNSNI